MGRLIRVVLYSIIVLVMYFWITTLLKSYQQKKENQRTASLTVQDSTNSHSDSMGVLLNDELLSDSDIISGGQVYEKLDEAIDGISDEEFTTTAENNHEEVVSKSKNEEKKETSSKGVSNQPGGQYMVIAGSFIKEENARSQLKKLKSIGYNHAEIKIFVSSEYYSVIVSRHTTQNEADKVVQDLKKNGIESFSKAKQ
ncbi:MAG: SPOR domain-containing protein [Saprospiraceae bacterium]